MPLKQFKSVSDSCKLCRGEPELNLDGNSELPDQCPKCGQAIKPLQALTAPPARIARKPSTAKEKSARFRIYKRLVKEEYEKQ